MTPDLTAAVDDTHLDCVAALAIIRNNFDTAHRRVDADAVRFVADCEQYAGRLEATG